MTDTHTPTTALVPYLGHGHDGADAWLRMHPSDRRRTAMQAARERDGTTLWSLTETWTRTFTRVGADIAEGTVRNYKRGVAQLIAAWRDEDLLRPAPDAATSYVRHLQTRGLTPGTIATRLAAARGLYAALRWARACPLDPFRDVHAPHDPTPSWEKRHPYDDDEVAALLAAATDPCDRALVLLGAHAGLRAGECVALCWHDVHLARRDVLVRQGKGGKTRTVAISATLTQALRTVPHAADSYVLPYRTNTSAWRRMRRLCDRAGVSPKGMHSLRHSAGTRLFAETGDLEMTARHLGHARLDTTRIYAKWSDRRLRETIGRW